MSWRVIARRDFRDAVQSRALWALVVVFVILSVLSSYAFVEAPEVLGDPTGETTIEGLLFFTSGLLALFVPLAAIVTCYKSIAGERERGSLKLLLALPTTRREIFAGKVLGRVAVLTVGLGVGVLVGLVVGSVLVGEFTALGTVVFVAVTGVFIAVYGMIMVGISATTGSTSRATTLALGFFVVLELVWDVVLMGVLYVVEGFSLPAEIPSWFFPLAQLSPSTAYVSALVAVLPEEEAAEAGDTGPMDAVSQYPEFGIVVLGVWIVLAAVVGAQRFEAADL